MKKLVSILFLGLALITPSFGQDSYQQSIKFIRFLDYLDKFYVDSVHVESVVEDAIKDILKDLDPHSVYISQEDFKRMNEPLQGNFEGIGISFNILKDTLYVISPISGGPSEKVGIRAGDRILKVDGNNVAGIGLTNEDVFDMLRGAKGTKVTVSVQRRRVSGLLDFTITRDKIPLYSIDATYMVDDKTGYIKINRFSATTFEEFQNSLDSLLHKGAKNLILDLTGNGGGYLDAAVNIADEFISKGKTIVYTEGLNAERQDFFATSQGKFEQGNVVVMIDEGSASASEIVTGAIQDWDRGIVVGRRSFGKGLVQRQLMLPDQSAIRLTIARYYTPSGRLIQKPYDEGTDAYHHEILDRLEHGEFATADSIQFPDSLKYKTLVNQRIVFGGGGITPDIFIPFDTSYFSDYYGEVVRQGVVNSFVLSFVDNNRNKLTKSYPTFAQYDNGFEVSESMQKEFINYAAKEGVKSNVEGLETSKDRLWLLIKSLIARDLFTSSEFYQVLNTSEPAYQKAVEVLNNWDDTYSEVFK